MNADANHDTPSDTRFSERVSAVVQGLDLEQKVSLLSGADVWNTPAIEAANVGAIKVTDGPNGARGDSTTGATAICLPAAIGLGACFDRDLVIEVGALLGRETIRKGAQVLLAPTINLARHPLGGRNFESFGEDPFLTAELAVAYVNGVQSEGVAACAKHFVANDVEYARMTVSYEVPEHVLREIYLAPFEAVVEAGVWTIMASYPMLNGIHCTEHRWLLTDVLRNEWGYDGLVMSDWGATHHRSRPVIAGLDLEMPGPPAALGAKLIEAIAEGEVSEAVLDERASRVVELADRLGRLGRTDVDEEQSVEHEQDRALARRAAAEGMVLLANDGTLPLAAATRSSVAVIGPNALDAVIQGGGSAQVPAHRIVDPVAGLVDALGADVVSHHQGCTGHRYLPPVPASAWDGGDRPITHEGFATDELTGEPVERDDRRSIGAFIHGSLPRTLAAQRWSGRLPIETSGRHSFGVLAVGRSRVFVDGVLVADNWTAPRPGDAFFQYATDEVVGEIELAAGTIAEVVVEWAHSEGTPLAGLRLGHLPPLDHDALLEEAVVAATGAEAAIVVVGLNNEWETEGHDRSSFSLPGRQDELVRRVAAANPRTIVVLNAGGPVDVPWIDDVAAVLVAWYPGQEFGHALADVLLGAAEPGGRLPVSWPRRLADTPFELPIPEPGPPRPGAVLPYDEGLLIGHRSYVGNGVSPRAAFGFGLGYTTFDIGAPSIDETEPGTVGDGPVTISVPVTNTGDRAGKCVLQAYVEAPAEGPGAAEGRPPVALAGFATVRPDVGATATAALTIPARAFARWDGDTSAWVTDPGERTIRIGLSSEDVVDTVTTTRRASSVGYPTR